MRKINRKIIIAWMAVFGCVDGGSDDLNVGEDDIQEEDLRCLIGEWNPTCALPISGNTHITHISRNCDSIAPDLERQSMPGLDGWSVQTPVPSIEFSAVTSWPAEGFYCAGGREIELGPLKNPRCGRACETCVERCTAEYHGVSVMITPECLLGAHTLNVEELPECP